MENLEKIQFCQGGSKKVSGFFGSSGYSGFNGEIIKKPKVSEINKFCSQPPLSVP